MSATLRLLHVEDSASDAKLVSRELRRTWPSLECERVETADAMRCALQTREWDVVLSDWSMPKFSASAALAILKEIRLDLPFILVSGTIGEENAVEIMRAGAHDYVPKDNLRRLTPALERELRESQQHRARHRAEEALRQSEARFARLSESGIVGLVVADLQKGLILDANDTYLALLGYTRQDLVEGRIRWSDQSPPELGPLTIRAVDLVKRTGVAPPWETEVFGKDGARVPVLIGAARLDEQKSIAFVADLSERKRAEAGRLQAEKALRESEQQLRQAQKMEAVGRLAGGVAHDFNNILSVILGYTDLILANLESADPLFADVSEIRKAGERATTLTSQLLNMSRQQVVEQRIVDVGKMISGLESMLRRLVGEDVELASLPPACPLFVKADQGHLEQVLMNLVVNARDAMPSGGSLSVVADRVSIPEGDSSTQVAMPPGDYVRLAVSDSGTGMDAETQSRIFEPFYTTKPIEKGTGLGLSTVFGIVQQSGGSICVQSEPGKGTTFTVYLPSVEAGEEAVGAQAPVATPSGTETVLVVEDDPHVRTIVSNILQRQGYRVLTAENPTQALELGTTHPEEIALLLTDVVMPGMYGPELATEVAKHRPRIRVLFMSGYTDESTVRMEILQSGAAYIQKPLTPASLNRKVREVLGAPAP